VHAAAAKITAGLNTTQYVCTSAVVLAQHDFWQQCPAAVVLQTALAQGTKHYNNTPLKTHQQLPRYQIKLLQSQQQHLQRTGSCCSCSAHSRSQLAACTKPAI
jgi:hypothetical protein